MAENQARNRVRWILTTITITVSPAGIDLNFDGISLDAIDGGGKDAG
jgi:hypothetical protein